MANNRKLSELIDKAQTIHKNKFDVPLYNYDKIKYAYQKDGFWEIYCVEHSFTFHQHFNKHLAGQTGCKECSSERKAAKTLPKRTKDFLLKAQSIHVNSLGKPIYIYSKVAYINNHKNVIIECREHGDFEMTPANHTHKTKPQKCPKCSGRNVRSKEEFIAEAEKLHVDSEGKPLYNYKEINYIDTTKHILIYCNKHKKKFRQTPAKHLSGQKCRDCAIERVTKKNTMTTDEFIQAAKLVHKDSQGNPIYDYSQVDYINNHTNITIICKHHGSFSQIPSVHKDSRSGCPKCSFSKGEQFIAEYLNEKNIPFEPQHTFPDCKNKKLLPFDFMVELNGEKILLEYHGKVHFEPAKYTKDEKVSKANFIDVQKRDKLKKEYAKKNSIPLYELTYLQDYNEIRIELDEIFKSKRPT